jgi:acyl carrier protein
MKEEVINILNEIRPEFDFSENINFIEAGMLDSFDIVALVDSIEQVFGVSIMGSDIIPDNFCSLDAIVEVINNNKNKKC